MLKLARSGEERIGNRLMVWLNGEGAARVLCGVVRHLHGDIHHGNVLHSREREWLAIDPKGLIGERGFEYANIFCNPNLTGATRPGRLTRQADVVAEAAGLDRTRLLQWVLAYAGPSASWWLEDRRQDEAEPVLEVARLAAAELGR